MPLVFGKRASVANGNHRNSRTRLYCSVIEKPLGGPTCITAFATILSVALCDREALAVSRRVARSGLPRDRRSAAFDWRPSIRRTSPRQAERMAANAGNLTTAFGFAAVSNLINNLPVGLIGATLLHTVPVSGQFANAMLIWIDLGPYLSVSRSLATNTRACREAAGQQSASSGRTH